MVGKTKFKYLPGNPLIIDESVAILGNIGWYDYSLRNEKWDSYLKERKTWYWAKTLDGAVWNDAKYAEWGMHDLDTLDYLLKKLEEDYEKINHIENKLLVLHHIPFKEEVLYKDKIEWDYFSAFMGSEKLGKKVEEWGINMVVYGHTHGVHEYKKGKTQCYCSPIGYEHEWESQDTLRELKERIQVIRMPIL